MCGGFSPITNMPTNTNTFCTDPTPEKKNRLVFLHIFVILIRLTQYESKITIAMRDIWFACLTDNPMVRSYYVSGAWLIAQWCEALYEGL